jgi:hypothetical protein
MARMTVVTEGSTSRATAFGVRQAHALLVLGALITMAVLVVLLLAAQSNSGTRATVLPARELVQQNPVVDQAIDPPYFPGRPY